jgi:hypothetical protein
MKHRATRLLPLSVIVAALAIGISASAANATIQYEWKVKGAVLKAGQEKEVAWLKEQHGVAHLSWAWGPEAVELTSEYVYIPLASLKGGKPGKTEGKVVFKNVKTVAPTGCRVAGGKWETEGPMVGEIVESAEAGKGTGKTELLISPGNSKNRWGKVVFETREGQTCMFSGANEKVVLGTTLMEISPQKTEATVGDLGFQSTREEYRNAAGEFHKASLKALWEFSFEEVPATLTGGEAAFELGTKEVFGAF